MLTHQSSSEGTDAPTTALQSILRLMVQVDDIEVRANLVCAALDASDYNWASAVQALCDIISVGN
jgi:hypothetical protein